MHNRSVQVKVPKIPEFINLKTAVPKVKTLHSFLSSLSIYNTISDCSREEKAVPSILDSCSQK